MNRVKTALTQGTSGASCWGLDYSYDIYANLKTVSLDPGRPSCTWTTLTAGVDTNNRVTNTGFSYDAAGNVLSDGSFSYTWDAESELKTAATITYTYDGDGRRVQKSNGKLYWYGAGGEILDESDASGNLTDEFVFFGGKRIARRNISSGNIYYYLADHLGTARMIVQAGQTSACYDADFDPFGGEHIITNTCPQNYKFNGKERDTESQLDDFEARYYSSQFGRFHSADWSAIPAPVPYADLGNPQTLNLYAYVKNNPLNLTDPTGHLGVGQLGSSDGMNINFRMRAGGDSVITGESYTNFEPPTEAALEAMAVNNAAAIAGLLAQQQAQQGQQQVSLNMNVIYDRDANVGKGLSDAQKKSFQGMLDETMSLYGRVGIKFNVTFTTDSITYDMGGIPLDIGGARVGALNTFVTGNRLGVAFVGSSGDGGGSSTIFKGMAFNFIGLAAASHWTLSHETAHHLLGHTKGQAGLIAKVMPEIYINRFVLPHITKYSDVLRNGVKNIP